MPTMTEATAGVDAAHAGMAEVPFRPVGRGRDVFALDLFALDAFDADAFTLDAFDADAFTLGGVLLVVRPICLGSLVMLTPFSHETPDRSRAPPGPRNPGCWPEESSIGIVRPLPVATQGARVGLDGPQRWSD